MQFEWKGVMPAVTTKFTDNDTLDLKMFGKNINAQIEACVHGLVLGGSLGEASTLTSDEKVTLIKETVNLADKKIPVVMTIAEQATKVAIEEVQKAQKSGADALMV
ncbi:MAG: dihydrodipicolinate synthase family protein, partial [Pricia sp.]